MALSGRASQAAALLATKSAPLLVWGAHAAAADVRTVCDADRMPGTGIAPGAAQSRSRPLPWRLWPSALAESPSARHLLGVISLAVLYRAVAQIGYELQF